MIRKKQGTKGNRKPSAHWKVLESTQIYAQPPWITLRKEVVQLPNGKIVRDYHQLELPDFVVVVATTYLGQVVTLQQYKHGVRRQSITLPGGMVEHAEEPMHAAQREFFEETGYFATDWRHIGSYTVHGNLGAGKGHFFSADMAKPIATPDPGDLEEMKVVLLNQKELISSLWNGEIALLNHATAVSLAFLRPQVIKSES